MRYYVTADIHGYFTELATALTRQGFFDDPLPHKLVICGDIFDRGGEAVALQEFLLELLAKDQLILIRGNHEDLAMSLIYDWHHRSYLHAHHHSNGTIDTLCQLTSRTLLQLYAGPDQACRDFLHSPFIRTLLPAMVDYFETDRYIFTHGWIPCIQVHDGGIFRYQPVDDWRNADSALWQKARWINGMEAAHSGILEVGKTIICGHWHCSFGHSHYENDGGEFDASANFDPYYANGIIALDACTAHSHQVNCIVLTDNPSTDK